MMSLRGRRRPTKGALASPKSTASVQKTPERQHFFLKATNQILCPKENARAKELLAGKEEQTRLHNFLATSSQTCACPDVNSGMPQCLRVSLQGMPLDWIRLLKVQVSFEQVSKITYFNRSEHIADCL